MIWSNLMFARHQQTANRRPLVLARFGGLGNHRAPLGFSGDSHACWQTLAYQIGFTSTAANVLQVSGETPIKLSTESPDKTIN
jgi:alpha-glucosidase (family GH31 glycosyl hydrolase)